jgi:hypothetical protein
MVDVHRNWLENGFETRQDVWKKSKFVCIGCSGSVTHGLGKSQL